MTADAAVAESTRAPSDAQVIARALTDPAAFATIFDRHHDAIHGYLRRRLDAAIAHQARRDRRDRAALGVIPEEVVPIESASAAPVRGQHRGKAVPSTGPRAVVPGATGATVPSRGPLVTSGRDGCAEGDAVRALHHLPRITTPHNVLRNDS
jgi:hypothetical protein